MSHINMPGYEGDLVKLENELGKIWNAFLRGQLIITSLTMLFYVIILGGLGVQYFYVLAVVAGIARFIPYLGAWLSWTTFGLVAFFQGSTLFGMESLPYAFLVVGLAIITDTIMDNIVTPRILSDALKVHPAAVMVAAIIGISWLGVIGVILAAPVLATLKLFMDYSVNKLFDQNPWAGISSSNQRPSFSLRRDLKTAWNKIKEIFNLLLKKEKKG